MRIVVADDRDFEGFLHLAAEVETIFGPMVKDDDFHDFLRRNFARGAALVARVSTSEVMQSGVAASSTRLVGGLVFSHRHHPVYTAAWLVVTAQQRMHGIGRALLAEAFRRWVRPPCVVHARTFGEDHPGAPFRRFYERLGFEPAGYVEDWTMGGSRLLMRMQVDAMPTWADRGLI